MKPVFYSEKGRHLKNSRPYFIRSAAKAFKSECKLMPYFIAYYLVIRTLHNKANFRRLTVIVKCFRRSAVVQNLSVYIPVRRYRRL